MQIVLAQATAEANEHAAAARADAKAWQARSDAAQTRVTDTEARCVSLVSQLCKVSNERNMLRQEDSSARAQLDAQQVHCQHMSGQPLLIATFLLPPQY